MAKKKTSVTHPTIVVNWRYPDTSRFEKLSQNIRRLLKKLTQTTLISNLLKEYEHATDHQVIHDFFSRFFCTEEFDKDRFLKIYSYFTNNTVLQDKHGCLVIIRLNQHPLFQDVLPRGQALGVASYIKFAHDDSSPIVLTPENFIITHDHTQPMRYERGFPVRFCAQSSAKSAPSSNKEIPFTNTILRQLPKIDSHIARQFHSWFNYLDFEKNFDQMQTVGLRYLDWQYEPLSETLYFLTVCNDAKYNEYTLGHYEGYELNFLTASTSQFPFKFAAKNYEELPFSNYFEGTAPVEPENIIREEDFALRAHELPQGILRSYRACKNVVYDPTQEKLFIQDCQNAIAQSKKEDFRESPHKQVNQEGLLYTIIGVHLNNENLAQLRQVPYNQVHEHPVLKRIPYCGFMTGQVIGHIILNNRQRRNLENLSNGTNLHASYLAQYLFDIKNAYRPQQLPKITKWFNPNLNGNQKLAVQKMLADTNLCLIQGPPGTGKTTVIAEAILQLISQGQKVLLSSQSHDAIDNAISRVKSHPELRGIRLANYTSRITDLAENYKGENSLISYYHTLGQHFQQHHQQSTTRKTQVSEFIASARAALEKYEELYSSKFQDKEFRLLFSAYCADLEGSLQLKYSDEETDLIDFNDRPELREVIPYLRSFWYGETDFLPKDKAANIMKLIYPLLANIAGLIVHNKIPMPVFEGDDQNFNAVKRFLLALRDFIGQVRKIATSGQKAQENLERLQEIQQELFLKDELSDADLAQLQEVKKKLKALKENLVPQHDNPHQLPTWSEWMATHVEPLYTKNEDGSYPLSVFAAYDKPSRTILRYVHQQTSDHPEVQQALNFYVYCLLNQQFEKFAQFISQENVQIYTFSNSTAPTTVQQLEFVYGDVFKAHQTFAKILADFEDLQIGSFEDIEDATVKVHTQNLPNLRGQASQLLKTQVSFPLSHKISPSTSSSKYKSPTHASEVHHLIPQIVKIIIQKAQAKNQATLSQDTTDFCNQLMHDLLQDPTAQAQNDWNDLHQDFIEDANLVAITCNEGEETYNRYNLSSFDVVIIDEVSKVTPIELLQPLMRARRAILVGDHNQLPPTYADKYINISELETATAHYKLQKYGQQYVPDYAVVSEENQQKYTQLYTDSLFKHLYEEADPILKERLTEQYRMHPTIMDIDNMFYDGELSCGNPDKERHHHVVITQGRKSIIDNNTHMIWVDTTKDEQNLDYVSESNNVNRVEARLIAKTLYEMDQALEQNPEFKATTKVDVGVVSFYQPQCQAIRREIRAILEQHDLREFRHLQPDVNSVIRFQGKEKPIILLSLVKNLPQQYDKTMLDSTAHISSPNFINVAISRAQNLLMIFGAKRMLENRAVRMHDNPHGENHKLVYHNIFNYIAEHSADSTREYTAREFSLNFKAQAAQL